MSSSDILPILLPVLLVLLFAIAATLGMAGAVHVEPRLRAYGSAALPSLLLAGFALSILFSGRNATLYGSVANLVTESGSQISTWILRLATASAVGGSAIVILSALLRKTTATKAGRPLFLAFCGYFFSAYVVSGIFGTSFFLSYKTFYPFVIICALYLSSDTSEHGLLRVSRDTMLLFLLAGLVLIPIAPDLVRQGNFSGMVPAIHFRYWGLSSHANNVGPLAIFFLILVYWLPYRSRSLNVIAFFAAATTILLSQSKTAYVVTAVVAGVFALRLMMQSVSKRRFGTVGGMVGIGISMAIVIAMLLVLVTGLYEKPLDYVIGKLLVRNSFLTGREVIWSITIGEWEHNPLFGYGPSIWGDEFSAKYGYLGVASNAHNQLLDTLGASGYFGLTFFVIYFSVLLRYAIKIAAYTRWASIALFVLMGLRCFTEVPFKTINITTSDFFMHALVIGVFMRAASSTALAKAAPKQSQSARLHPKFA